MNAPDATSCQSVFTVTVNGTMKAWLVERPAISQSDDAGEDAEPGTRPWRRRAV